MKKRITSIGTILNPLRVVSTQTGAQGEVIDICDTYRVRVLWGSGRISRVPADDLREMK